MIFKATKCFYAEALIYLLFLSEEIGEAGEKLVIDVTRSHVYVYGSGWG